MNPALLHEKEGDHVTVKLKGTNLSGGLGDPKSNSASTFSKVLVSVPTVPATILRYILMESGSHP